MISSEETNTGQAVVENESPAEAVHSDEAPEITEESGEHSTEEPKQGKDQASPADDTTKESGSHANWDPFFPPLEVTFPISLKDRLEEHQAEMQQRLADKELLLLAKVDKNIHQSYYDMWVAEANLMFRSLVRVKGRLDKLRRSPQAETTKDID